MTSIATQPKSLQNRASDTAMNLHLPRSQHDLMHERPASASGRRGKDKPSSGLGQYARSIHEKSRSAAERKLDGVKKAAWKAQGQDGRSKGFDVDLSERLPVSLSSLTGLVVGKKGRILNREGHIIGQVVEGNPEDLVGEMVGEDGDILDEDGDVIGCVDIVYPSPPKGRDGATVSIRETTKDSQNKEDTADDKVPHVSTLEGFTCNKDGDIVTPDGVTVGELCEGNPKTISGAGFQLDDQGSFWDYRGVTVGKARPTLLRDDDKNPFADQDLLVAERSWVQQKHKPGTGSAGMVEGFTGVCALEGMKVDKHGNVVDQNGVVFGHVIVSQGRPADKSSDEEVQDEEVQEEEVGNMQKHARFDLVSIVVNDDGYAVDKQEMAEQMCIIVRQIQNNVESLCSRITLRLDETDRTPKDQLDEKKAVQDVKPLIEKAGDALQDCKGALTAIGPNNHMAETMVTDIPQMASDAEHELAELLQELAEVVMDTITNGRYLVANMSQIKKGINPQWPLMSEPLFQILSTVGLLLNGLYGLFTRMVDAVWLGKTIRDFLAAWGIDQRILYRLGVERILRGVASREVWAKQLLAKLGLWWMMKGLLDLFGLDKLLEAFRLATVREGLELRQRRELVTRGG
ncbi:DUF3659 domain-containing protein [Aspergillus stella-maris]|uniref:DUF3659 domain-containing protein n=1 Tax=Aspergillus stella-maris TaxID=1810926 RepID=UPI003CCDBB01